MEYSYNIVDLKRNKTTMLQRKFYLQQFLFVMRKERKSNFVGFVGFEYLFEKAYSLERRSRWNAIVDDSTC